MKDRLTADMRASAGGVVLAVVVLGLFLVVGLTAVNQQFTETGADINTTESFVADPGNVTQLNGSNIEGAFYDERVTVTDDKGRLVTEGEDYLWYQQNGTIKTLQGGALSDGENVTISYRYSAPTPQARGFLSILTTPYQVLRYLPLVLVGLAVLMVLSKVR